jgi:GDP-mannose 6-dehydrogenase
VKLSIFGLGYVGVVCAACLAEAGHDVVGVEPNQLKVDLVNAGRSPVIEEGIDERLSSAVRAGRLWATTDCETAVSTSEMALVCVGTPSRRNGSLDLTYLHRVSQEIGRALAHRQRHFVVVVRSTVLPGTVRSVVIPALEAESRRRCGTDFGVCVYPEFMREGSAVRDFHQQPKVVIGATDDRSRQTLTSLVSDVAAPFFQTEIELAEITKYADNAWHALKVAFANEIGTLSKAHGIDGREVMEIFCADEKLNLSPSYLKPGFAFVGSCLPKDVRALSHEGRRLDLDLPLLESVLPSNSSHLERAFEAVAGERRRRVGVLGLSFKAGTDDLRESPVVELVERLLGKGFDVRIYDGRVSLARLVGANREFILRQIPHLADLLLPTLDDVLDHSEVVVIGNGDDEFKGITDRLQPGQRVVDLVGLADAGHERVDGIAW